MFGAWRMVHGAWRMMHGTWCMAHDVWRMMHGAWFMPSWCMAHGAWCMVPPAGFRPLIKATQEGHLLCLVYAFSTYRPLPSYTKIKLDDSISFSRIQLHVTNFASYEDNRERYVADFATCCKCFRRPSLCNDVISTATAVVAPTFFQIWGFQYHRMAAVLFYSQCFIFSVS